MAGIREQEIIAELRLHTDRYMTQKETIEAAKEANLSVIGITNQFMGTGDRVTQKIEIQKLYEGPERLARFLGDSMGIRVIGGVEIHIGQKYNDLEVIKELPIRVGKLNELFWGIQRQDLDALEKEIKELIDRGYINVVASPERKIGILNGGKYSLGLTPAVKQYYQWLVDYCKKNRVLLEVCEESLWNDEGGDFERLEYWVRLAKENNNPIIVSSNAYVTQEVGSIDRAIQFLNYIGYPKKLIVNSSEKSIELLFPNEYNVSKQSRLEEEGLA